MSTNLTLKQHRDRMILEALERRARVTLTGRDAEGWRIFHGQLSGATPVRTLEVELKEQDREATPGRLEEGAAVGLTFRRGHKKCLSSVTVKEVASDHHVTLTWPTYLQELQRRVFERTQPLTDHPIKVEFWPVADAKPKTPELIKQGDVEDISVGGVRLKVPVDRPLDVGATYCCALDCPSLHVTMTLDAILRHHEAPHAQGSSVGLQFIGLETVEGGQAKMLELARLVKNLQRRRGRPARLP